MNDALGDIPLDDVSEEELGQVDFQGLEKLLSESLHALEIIRAFYRAKTLSDSDLNTLRQIRLEE